MKKKQITLKHKGGDNNDFFIADSYHQPVTMNIFQFQRINIQHECDHFSFPLCNFTKHLTRNSGLLKMLLNLLEHISMASCKRDVNSISNMLTLCLFDIQPLIWLLYFSDYKNRGKQTITMILFSYTIHSEYQMTGNRYSWMIVTTVESPENTVVFLQNTHKRCSIAHARVRGMECLW